MHYARFLLYYVLNTVMFYAVQYSEYPVPHVVSLQDFTGVPAVVDFAAMRDAVQALGGNPEAINPLCPSDLVIDHSVQVILPVP